MTEVNDRRLALEDALADAHNRFDRAREKLSTIEKHAEEEQNQRIEEMFRGWNPNRESYQLTLPSMRRSKGLGLPIMGRAAYEVAEAYEHIRAGLNYAVAGVARCQTGVLSRITQLAIADSAERFKEQAKRQLRGLTKEQVQFIEQFQPYYGNYTFQLLKELTNTTKHRSLESLEIHGAIEVVLAPRADAKRWPGHTMVLASSGEDVMYYKKDPSQRLLLLGRYELIPVTSALIDVSRFVVDQLLESVLSESELPNVRFECAEVVPGFWTGR